MKNKILITILSISSFSQLFSQSSCFDRVYYRTRAAIVRDSINNVNTRRALVPNTDVTTLNLLDQRLNTFNNQLTLYSNPDNIEPGVASQGADLLQNVVSATTSLLIGEHRTNLLIVFLTSLQRNYKRIV